MRSARSASTTRDRQGGGSGDACGACGTDAGYWAAVGMDGPLPWRVSEAAAGGGASSTPPGCVSTATSGIWDQSGHLRRVVECGEAGL
ncbi:hypothetical protein GCM10010245_38170 [Streptomyces spectabilis]|nr:hypothetical protein GCM10010245_38170 [Streptomyces spectabilis]